MVIQRPPDVNFHPGSLFSIGFTYLYLSYPISIAYRLNISQNINRILILDSGNPICNRNIKSLSGHNTGFLLFKVVVMIDSKLNQEVILSLYSELKKAAKNTRIHSSGFHVFQIRHIIQSHG